MECLHRWCARQRGREGWRQIDCHSSFRPPMALIENDFICSTDGSTNNVHSLGGRRGAAGELQKAEMEWNSMVQAYGWRTNVCSIQRHSTLQTRQIHGREEPMLARLRETVLFPTFSLLKCWKNDSFSQPCQFVLHSIHDVS